MAGLLTSYLVRLLIMWDGMLDVGHVAHVKVLVSRGEASPI